MHTNCFDSADNNRQPEWSLNFLRALFRTHSLIFQMQRLKIMCASRESHFFEDKTDFYVNIEFVVSIEELSQLHFTIQHDTTYIVALGNSP